MNRGRTLMMALEQLARSTDPEAPDAERPSVPEHIAPLRPGAFAAWAARQAPAAAPSDPRGNRAARPEPAPPVPVGRSLREGPPVL